jgi:hypothetical protein
MLALARHQQGNLAAEIVLAFIFALLVAAATGTVALDSAALTLWAVAGFALYIAGHHLLSGKRQREGGLSLLVGFIFIASLVSVGDGGSLQPLRAADSATAYPFYPLHQRRLLTLRRSTFPNGRCHDGAAQNALETSGFGNG